jgi:DNA helicase IV
VLGADDLDVLAGGWGEEFSVEDVALLDELRYELGDPPDRVEEEPDPLAHLVDENMPELTTVTERQYSGPRTANRTEDDGYAHVLVDEAQDLTPMQWRMVGRRGRTATWTVVGDPAQSSWPHPEEAAAAREEALYRSHPGGRPRHAFHLGTNYRNSAEIYRYAAAYAERVGLSADLPDAVRTTGVEPVEAVVDVLEEGVRVATAELLATVEGTVGVVVPAARREEVAGWLSSWPEVAEALAGGASARVAVLTGLDTKGLEFDGIVVVEPDEIERESVTGRATLYVVLTRATQRLVTVTTR